MLSYDLVYGLHIAREVSLDIPSPQYDRLWKALFPSMTLMRQEMATSGSWAEEDTKHRRSAEVAEYKAWRQPDGYSVHLAGKEGAAAPASSQNDRRHNSARIQEWVSNVQ